METLIHDSAAAPRFRTWLIGLFSIFALGLACLGIYGVIAYLVTQRDKEIGIRLALGATRASILQLILGQTFRLAAAGIVVGLFAAFFVTRFLRTILFGVTAHDPLTFIAVPLGLVAIALLAGYLPARRATRIDPVRSLRSDQKKRIRAECFIHDSRRSGRSPRLSRLPDKVRAKRSLGRRQGENPAARWPTERAITSRARRGIARKRGPRRPSPGPWGWSTRSRNTHPARARRCRGRDRNVPRRG